MRGRKLPVRRSRSLCIQHLNFVYVCDTKDACMETAQCRCGRGSPRIIEFELEFEFKGAVVVLAQGGSASLNAYRSRTKYWACLLGQEG